MPGSKDYKSVKEGGVRVQKQKRLLLMYLNEADFMFKKRLASQSSVKQDPKSVQLLETRAHIQFVCVLCIRM